MRIWFGAVQVSCKIKFLSGVIRKEMFNPTSPLNQGKIIVPLTRGSEGVAYIILALNKTFQPKGYFIMGLLIKADFKKKLDIKLYRFDPKNPKPEYHAEIFCEMFSQFPQFKAHVAAYIERNYCFVVNDEDHSDPRILLDTLSHEEVKRLNEWVLLRNKPGIIAGGK